MTGVYFETESTTESNGFRCGDFSFAGETSSCSGSAFYSNSDGTSFTEIQYSSKGSVEFGTLKTSSSLIYTPGVDPSSFPGGGPLDIRLEPSYGNSYGSASFRDNWTISSIGRSGEQGTVKLVYELDGINESPSINGVSVGSSANIRVVEIGEITSPSGTIITVIQSGTGINTGFNGAYNEVLGLELGFTFDQEFTIGVQMNSLSSFNFFNELPSAFSTYSDFFSTASLQNIQVLNENGELIDFSLSTASDSQTFEQFSTTQNPGTVPIPSVLLLVLTGLGCFWWIRMRSNNHAT